MENGALSRLIILTASLYGVHISNPRQACDLHLPGILHLKIFYISLFIVIRCIWAFAPRRTGRPEVPTPLVTRKSTPCS